MQITIKGYPVTFHTHDLRAKADRWAMDGQQDEAALLHALLDNYAPAAEADMGEEIRDLKKDLECANEEKEDAEGRAEKAEEALAAAQEVVREALEAVQKALAYQYEREEARALEQLGRAVGALSSAVK